jgi:hypothetical protein
MSQKPKLMHLKQKGESKVKKTVNPTKSNKTVTHKSQYQEKDDKMSNNFYLALSDPFNPKSIGCTVPDPFPFPTEAYHLHQTTVMSGGSFTTFGGLFLPNPILSLIDTFGISRGGGSTVGIISTPFVQYSANDYRYDLYGACSASSLSNIFSSYRVVSWGLKISNLQPELSATGRIIISHIPIGDTVPSYVDLAGNVLSSNIFTSICGLNYTQLLSSGTLELPTAIEITVQDLLHGDMEVSGMYTNSSFWNFKSTQTYGVNGTQVIGDEIVYTVSGGAVNSGGFKDDTRSVGGCGINIYCEGFPANSLGIQVETIYHLEGSPIISSGGNSIPVPSNTQRLVIGSTTAVEKAMSKASSIDNVFEFISKGAGFLNNNKDLIARGASMLSHFV